MERYAKSPTKAPVIIKSKDAKKELETELDDIRNRRIVTDIIIDIPTHAAGPQHFT